MSQTSEYFEKNGYVVLKDVLTRDQCRELTKHMFTLLEQGKLTNDDQCPLSDAVYGDEIFDSILQRFAKPIGNAVGRALLPTYTYARIYRPGELLKKHTDRPSCEISGTMTLGFDADVIWPIVFDDDKEISVSLDVGEMAVYKGCDVSHWRKPFKGRWHVQVFLHYVDANGPHKNHFRDGRETFGIKKETEQTQTKQEFNKNDETRQQIKIPKRIYDGVMIPSADKRFPGYFCVDSNTLPELKFTNEECDKIISLSSKIYPSTASVGGTHENSKVHRLMRSAEIYNIENTEQNRWIFEKVANIVSVINTIHFNYEITGITHGIQLIEYSSDADIKGHYDWHIDAGEGDPAHRKISLTAQLTEPSKYEGCELIINNHAKEVVGTKDRGSVHLFPSYMLHKVSPITKGTRHALVIWIHGSSRFR